MKHLLACLVLCASFNVSAQLPAPQNGDMDGDGLIGVGDILALLGSYGMSVTTATCPQANLSDAELYEAGLDGADLSYANLSGISLNSCLLWYANLSGADLSGAYLSESTLYESILSGANLSGAYIVLSNLYGADLSGADLSYAYLYGADLSGANLSGADLSYAIMTCLVGCPSSLPSGYTCEPDPDCSEPDRNRIVPE